MKIILTTIVYFILIPLSLFSQQEITGRVIEKATGKPVAHATVTIHPVDSPSILSYTMTSDEGTFSIRVNNLPDTVTLTVSAMTIERQSKTLNSNISFVEFIVIEKTMELNEVIVKAPKIRQLGDTIHYDIASFLNETDRSIGDILERLPGIQVLSSGQILYQNKEISKFYIEGLDLLQGKYGLATQNVDAQNVASVQILENHQPIKALKGMEIPENAAINLKLKQSAMGAFFATAQLGVGIPLVLLSNEAVGMRFTSSQQNMVIYKGDNTGRDISKELTSYYDYYGSGSTNLLSVVTPSPPSIRELHYLFNDAHLISLNDLRSLKKDLILTSNINFLHDEQKSNSLSRRNIFLTSSDTLQIEEDMNARLIKRELDGSITLESNTDNYFFNNKFNIRASWNTQNSDITSNELVSQSLRFPSLHIENNFDYVRHRNSWRNRIKANASYTSQNHSLGISPVLFEELKNPDSRIQQNVSYDRLNAFTYISGQKDFNRLSFGYNTGVSFLHYSMESNLLSGINHVPFLTDSLRNNISRTEAKLNFSPSLDYRASSGFRLNFSFPIDYLLLERKDEIRKTKHKGEHFLLSPFLRLQYSLNARTTFYSNLYYANNLGTVNEDYKGYILNTYRSMNRSDGMLSKNSRTSANINFEYKNPFTTLFTALRIHYENDWRNTLYNIEYSNILSSNVSIIHPHTSHQYGVSYSMGKSMSTINSEIRINTNYDRSQSLTLQQGSISNYNSDNYSLSPRITTNINRFMIMKYGASFLHNRTTVRDSRLKPINYITQDISISFIPAKGLTLTMSFNHYFNNMIESSTRSSWFGNLAILYKMKNIDWMIDWINIFNTREFTTYSYSDISSYYSIYKLRPSEIVLRVRFKIL